MEMDGGRNSEIRVWRLVWVEGGCRPAMGERGGAKSGARSGAMTSRLLVIALRCIRSSVRSSHPSLFVQSHLSHSRLSLSPHDPRPPRPPLYQSRSLRSRPSPCRCVGINTGGPLSESSVVRLSVSVKRWYVCTQKCFFLELLVDLTSNILVRRFGRTLEEDEARDTSEDESITTPLMVWSEILSKEDAPKLR